MLLSSHQDCLALHSRGPVGFEISRLTSGIQQADKATNQLLRVHQRKQSFQSTTVCFALHVHNKDGAPEVQIERFGHELVRWLNSLL